MKQHDQDRAHATAPTTATETELAPGKRTNTDALVGPGGVKPSGLVMRAARDGNGVADGALDQVAAVGSTGTALPGELQRKFETSLGADLSGVRVHTGGASASAASAVGARAYALGNDIHFGAGEYDPGSHAGEHLLAHEVAHTVQQTGRPQFKLAVSAPGDAHELEADRAADAMTRGAPFALSSSASPAIARAPIVLPEQEIDSSNNVVVLPEQEIDSTRAPRPPDNVVVLPEQDVFSEGSRDPFGDPELPQPIQWGGTAEGDIAGTWSGAPIFTMKPSGPVDQPDFVNRVTSMQAQFIAAWMQSQAIWNTAVPVFADYMQAAQDAESKGLADFGGKGSDIDLDADAADFGGGTVSDANLQDESKVQTGSSTFEPTRVDPNLKRAIVDQKTGVATAKTNLSSCELAIDSSKLSLDSAVKALDSATVALSVKKDAPGISELNAKMDAMKRSSALMGTALAGMVKTGGASMKGPTDAAFEGEAAAFQMLNTLVWDSKIADIESQLQVFTGAAEQADIEGADNAKGIAQNNVRIAVNAVRKAVNDYKNQCIVVKKAYATLAASLETASRQSTPNAKTSQRVRAAVEAIPLMELTLEKCRALQARCVTVPWSLDAGRGGAMTSNGSELATHDGILASWRGQMTEAVAKWEKRLALARQLVQQAH